MPPYEYLLTERAFHAIEACEDAEARQVLLAIEMLARDPRRHARFYAWDQKGRMIPWLEVGTLFVGYIVDHPAKRIEIVDVLRPNR